MIWGTRLCLFEINTLVNALGNFVKFQSVPYIINITHTRSRYENNLCEFKPITLLKYSCQF